MNAMNETPETDAIQIRLRDSDFRDSYIVMLGHAQKLERERNRARLDTARLDWLADRHNHIGNVQLPREIVEANIDSLRGAIDAAMKLSEPS